MQFNIHKNQFIYSCENDPINFWAKKWGVKTNEINDAIIETGSLQRKVLKKYLAQKGIIFSFSGTLYKLKTQFKSFKDYFTEKDEM